MMASQAILKLVRSLHQKKFRQSYQLFIAEGKKLCQESITSGWNVEYFLCSDEYPTNEIPDNTLIVRNIEFDKLTEQQNPEGILAIVQIPQPPMLDLSKGHYFLIEGIQDPGNLGTIIRIADWFGFKGIICSEKTVDVFNSKVVRASMGSIFRVPILYEKKWQNFIETHANQINIADMSGKILKERDLNRNLFLLGNESLGVNRETLEVKNIDIVSIPSNGLAESLNVAISAGIIAYHVNNY